MYQTFINKYENSTIGLKIGYPEEWTASSFHLDYPLQNVISFDSPENDNYARVDISIYHFSFDNIQPNVKDLLSSTIENYKMSKE